MTEEYTTVVSRREYFPEDLDGRLNSVLNCVNTEFKSITLGYVLDRDVFKDAKTMAVEFERVSNRDLKWTNFECYSRQTFIPIGMTLEEVIKYSTGEEVPFWKLTEEGNYYGRPIAAFALKWSIENGKSMYEYLQRTAARGKVRAPFLIFKTLESLNRGSKRPSEISREQGIPLTSTRKHLVKLAKVGLIDYQPAKGGIKEYQWVEGMDPAEAQIVIPYKTLTQRIAIEFQRETVSNYYQLSRLLEYKHIPAISVVVRGLEQQGFVRSLCEKCESEDEEEVTILSPRGKEFIDGFLFPVRDALVDGKGLDEMRRILQEVDSSQLGHCYDLYRKVSPVLKSRPKQEWQKEILKLLKKEGNLRYSDIKAKLNYDPSTHLKELSRKNILNKNRNGVETHYSLNPEIDVNMVLMELGID